MLLILAALAIPGYLGFLLAAEKKKNRALLRQIERLETHSSALSTEEVYAALRELHPELPEISIDPLPVVSGIDPATLAKRLEVIRRMPRHGPSQVSSTKALVRELIVAKQFAMASEVIDLLPPYGPSRVGLLKELERAVSGR